MKVCKYIVVILTLMINLSSCGYVQEKMDIYSQIYERYNNIKDYKAQITMEVTSNKTVKIYEMQQYYQMPDKYKIEILKPEEIKGLTTIYSNDGITTVNPEVEGIFTLLGFNHGEKSYIFLPDFFENYYKSQQTEVMAMKKESMKYTILKANIPGNNIYRYSQSIWIDNDNLLPEKIEIYDIKGKPTISILFNDIQFDVKFNDETFKVN